MTAPVKVHLGVRAREHRGAREWIGQGICHMTIVIVVLPKKSRLRCLVLRWIELALRDRLGRLSRIAPQQPAFRVTLMLVVLQFDIV